VGVRLLRFSAYPIFRINNKQLEVAMNKERMYLLAELLETIPPAKFKLTSWTCDYDAEEHLYDVQEFSATLSAYDCGTAGCIAGWAVAMKNDLSINQYKLTSFEREAGEYLGLTPEEGRALFYYNSNSVWHHYRNAFGFDDAWDYDDVVEAKHAAYALRMLADGEWSFEEVIEGVMV
jgi:hypothetical protein